MKRNDYINWDEYFMGIAMLSCERSKDPNTRVGACIVSTDNKILSIGYNGAPIGFDDDKDMPWNRDGKPLDTKYLFVCHSELNAILNTRNDLRGSKMYVALFPCNECAKAIIQSGIKEVIYRDNLYPDSVATKVSIKMFKAANVKVTKYKNKNREIKLII